MNVLEAIKGHVDKGNPIDTVYLATRGHIFTFLKGKIRKGEEGETGRKAMKGQGKRGQKWSFKKISAVASSKGLH